MNEENIVMLTDDEGKEYAYEIANYYEVEGKEYVVLVPQDEEDDEVVILRVNAIDDETEEFVNEEDEAVTDKVFELFMNEFSEEYNFVDGEDDDAVFTDAE